MGIAYLMWIADDAIGDIDPKAADWDRLCNELGDGILRLTRDVGYFASTSPNRRTWHPLGNTSNAINYCDEAHSTDQRVYLWSGNRLCPLSRAKNDEIEFAAREIEQEKLHRTKTG